MGKLNEIQKQMTQSYGDNAFTTTIKDDTVEFDSLKDKFTFKDEVEVPSLKVGGEPVSSQVQADWNQNDNTKADYVKNRVCYEDNNETIFDSETLSGCEVKGNVGDDEITIVDGAQYTVIIDGNIYTGVGEDGDSIVYRGDDQSFVIVPGTLSYFTKFVGIPINSFTPSITIKDSNQTTLFSGVGSFRQEAGFELNYTEYLTDGQSYTISLNGNEYIGTASYGGAAIEIDGVLALYLDSGKLILIGNTAVPYLNTNVQFVLKQVTSTIHQLDEKFIPDTIARTSDIPAQVQSDWNQYDSSAADYIKNKPFGEETLFDISSYSGSSSFDFKFQSIPELGKTYVIQFDSTEYTTTTEDASSQYGSGSMIFSGFSMGSIYYIPNNIYNGKYSGNSSFTTLKSSSIKKIDSEYIPVIKAYPEVAPYTSRTLEPMSIYYGDNLQQVTLNTNSIKSGDCVNYKFMVNSGHNSSKNISLNCTTGTASNVKTKTGGVVSYSNSNIVIDSSTFTKDYYILFNIYVFIPNGWNNISIFIDYIVTE